MIADVRRALRHYPAFPDFAQRPARCLCRIAAKAGRRPARPFLSASQKRYNRKLLILLTLSEVIMHRWFAAFCCVLAISFAVPAQVKSVYDQPQSGSASGNKGTADLPKLEKFDPSLVDKTKNACGDFYQYTCTNWLAAHPITPDMPSTSTERPLFLYNQTILRNAL
jgi:hypothetical protein